MSRTKMFTIPKKSDALRFALSKAMGALCDATSETRKEKLLLVDARHKEFYGSEYVYIDHKGLISYICGEHLPVFSYTNIKGKTLRALHSRLLQEVQTDCILERIGIKDAIVELRVTELLEVERLRFLAFVRLAIKMKTYIYAETA